MGRRDKPILNGTSLGARLRQARQVAGISLSEMAILLGYTKSHLSAVETDVGRPSPGLLEKYAEKVGRSVEELKGVTTPSVSSKSGGSLLTPDYLGSEDWKEAPSFEKFFGRTQELKKLIEWTTSDNSKVISISGRAGIGKTTLTAALYNQIRGKFEKYLWFPLTHESSLKSFLKIAHQVFSNQQQPDEDVSDEQLISRLIEIFRNKRCLLVLDNVEEVLESGKLSGQYKEGFEGYSRLILEVGAFSHQSCLILSSREQLKEVLRQERKGGGIRSLNLGGLCIEDAMNILYEKGLSGKEEKQKELITLYEGNPLFLWTISSYIKTVFKGNIDQFLVENERVFGDLRRFLDEQFEQLSEVEVEILHWLAIEQEPVSAEELYRDLARPIEKGLLFEVLGALQRRSMIYTDANSKFKLQPDNEENAPQTVIMEYAWDTLIDSVFQDIDKEKITWLARYALIQAQAKDYVREIQEQVILQPLLVRLQAAFSERVLEEKLKHLLDTLRNTYRGIPGYAAGNILDILVHLQIDLDGYDFSSLAVRQAYLPYAQLRNVDFRNANLESSVFADTFGSILSIAFSKDGKLIAAGTSHSEIRLWQTQNFTPIQVLHGHRGWVWSVALSPDGKYLVSGSEDSTVRLWDVQTGQNLLTIRDYVGWVRAVAFHPGGKLIAFGGDEQTIKLYEIKETPSLTYNFYMSLQVDDSDSWIRSLSFSPDGTLLASGSEGQKVRVWDMQTGKCKETLIGHENRVRSVAFSRDGTWLASCGEDAYACLWDTRKREPEPIKYYLPRESRPILVSVAFSPREDLFATGQNNGDIHLWDINTPDKPIAAMKGHTNWIRMVAFHPDGEMIASGSEDHTLRLWETKTGKGIKTVQGYSSWMWSVAFGRKVNILVSGGEDKMVRIWDTNKNTYLKTMEGHRQRIWSVAFSPEGEMIASGSEDRTIRLWRADTGQHLKTLLGHTHRVRSVAFSGSGRILASGSEDQSIRLWDVNTGDNLRTLREHDRMIWAIAFSRKRPLIASGSADETVRLWNAESGDCLRVLRRHKGAVRAVAFNEEGSLVASGGDDQKIYLWDVDSGTYQRALEGHTNRIYTLAFSPDERFLASGSHDQTIRIWEVSTWQCIYTLEEHTSRVWSVSFSSDGQWLASSSEDGTIKIWDVDNGKCVQTMRSQKPYEGMQIADVKGLTPTQTDTLLALGAKEEDF